MLKILLSYLLVFNVSFAKSPTSNKQADRAPNSLNKVIRKPKINKLELMMSVYGSAKNRGAIFDVLKRVMSEENYRYLLNKARGYGVKLRRSFDAKYEATKRTLKISGYDEPFFVSKNGKAVKYKGKVFRYKKAGVKSSMEGIERKLIKKKSKSSFLFNILIPEANAEYGSGEINSASLDIMLLLNYLEVYFSGDYDFFNVLAYLADTDPAIYNAIRRLHDSNGNKRIELMKCNGDTDMTIIYSDGTRGRIVWNGVQGSGAKASVTENFGRSWEPVKFYYDNEETEVLNGQFFFCQMMRGEDKNSPRARAVTNALNEMIAPVRFDSDYGGGDSVDGN